MDKIIKQGNRSPDSKKTLKSTRVTYVLTFENYSPLFSNNPCSDISAINSSLFNYFPVPTFKGEAQSRSERDRWTFYEAIFFHQKPSANIKADLTSDNFIGLNVVMRDPILSLETV